MEQAEYHVGYISKYSLIRIWLVEHFWILLVAVILLSLMMAAWIRDYLVWLAETRLGAGRIA